MGLFMKKKYKELLKHPKWQKKRLEILNRDSWKCNKCGADDIELNVHHLSYSDKPWLVNDDQLITLCVNCHKDEHDRIKLNVSQKHFVILIQNPHLFKRFINNDDKYVRDLALFISENQPLNLIAVIEHFRGSEHQKYASSSLNIELNLSDDDILNFIEKTT